MNKKKHIIQNDTMDLAKRYKELKRYNAISDPNIISLDSNMTRDEEKRIIIDAVKDYVLSCNSNEANEFIGELTDIIVHACIEVL
jgi:hypothetical protein